MEKTKFYTQWSKTTGMTKADLEKIWKATVKELAQNSITSERIQIIEFGKRVRKVLWVKTQGNMKRREPIEFVGFIIGTSRLRDIDESKRRKALKAYRDDPMEAQMQGLVDEAGTPLDTRTVIKRYGKEVDNPNYHKPLVSHTYTRTLYGMARRTKGGDPKFWRMPLWRATAKNLRYKPFVPIEFLALVKGEDADALQLTPSKLTKFSVTSAKIPMEDWIRKNNGILTLDQLDKAVEICKGDWNATVFLEADVTKILTEINQNTNSRRIMIADSSIAMYNDLNVFIPAEYPLGFREMSRVLILGRARTWKRDEQSEERYSIEGFGVFPIPGMTVEEDILLEEAKPAEQSEEPVILWEE